MSKKPTGHPPTLEEVYKNLSDDDKTIELARGLTIEDFYTLVSANNRKEISSFIFTRFYSRYLMPFEKVNKDIKSGFSQMGVCCLMIEALESFRNGWNDTRYLKDPDGKDIKGGKIFGDFFKRYGLFSEIENLGNEFYINIRCGILHQAETKNGWLISRDGNLYDSSTRTINSTRFCRKMKKSLRVYCDELVTDDITWGFFKTKMAYIVQNCKKGEMEP